ncbi:hypothetical protein MPTK1_2g21270 [Marchantia polymorpha subsp. ruderalis]|uniref:Uncharacterized protein n=1 Tax=Marchantia polymorpha TaxID=3197 RepID=A0A2R6X2T0_MARPO|nr:hypothetical protein MARPO_0040s0087 [Marchantia polymorpha]BBN03162.1 hypothetical protein Mp_2g21270 [Marchantia polymorpha subsp. ruderalis]|eukprot:PTQ40415.1 hypothetical protein MARPO_0040s0087 [Marchantia polymorpha]
MCVGYSVSFEGGGLRWVWRALGLWHEDKSGSVLSSSAAPCGVVEMVMDSQVGSGDSLCSCSSPMLSLSRGARRALRMFPVVPSASRHRLQFQFHMFWSKDHCVRSHSQSPVEILISPSISSKPSNVVGKPRLPSYINKSKR